MKLLFVFMLVSCARHVVCNRWQASFAPGISVVPVTSVVMRKIKPVAVTAFVLILSNRERHAMQAVRESFAALSAFWSASARSSLSFRARHGSELNQETGRRAFHSRLLVLEEVDSG